MTKNRFILINIWYKINFYIKINKTKNSKVFNKNKINKMSKRKIRNRSLSASLTHSTNNKQ